MQYTAGNKLLSASGFITSTIYEADGQTKEITYANGVKTSFTYSPTRRWVTRVTTAKSATVLLDDQYARRSHRPHHRHDRADGFRQLDLWLRQGRPADLERQSRQ
ncbi:hypothetical protein [Mesorhizobium sp. M1272]|uniref:hypothetical protein n=1 Tax=Mesorhizobium sp. M1272 TaxID=2957074 RepID=UPI0033361590